MLGAAVPLPRRLVGLQIEKQRVRVVPDELETYQGVIAPTKKIVADKPDEAPLEMPKVGPPSHKYICCYSQDSASSRAS